jgi:DedD protein
MDPQLKQRVVGAAVLVAIGVVFIPLFLNESGDDHERAPLLDLDTTPPADFNSRVVPLDDETMEQVERALESTPEELQEAAGWGDETAAAVEPSDDGSPSPPPPSAPTAAPRTGVTAWVVQLGSFGSEDNANALLEKVKKGGYTAFIEPLHEDGKVVYRVRVGPELTKVTADQIRDKLAKDVAIKGIVMRYPRKRYTL